MVQICSEYKEDIVGFLGTIYRLGTKEDGLTFPEKGVWYPPNALVCRGHFNIPRELLNADYSKIEGVVYGVELEGRFESIAFTKNDVFNIGFVKTGDLLYTQESAVRTFQPGSFSGIEEELEIKLHALEDWKKKGYLEADASIKDLRDPLRTKVKRENPDMFWYNCLCYGKEDRFRPYSSRKKE